MIRSRIQEAPACPFINLGDGRCARHFTLVRLAEAFHTCLSGYQSCLTYQQLKREQAHEGVQVTLNGKRYLDSRELRPTGT